MSFSERSEALVELLEAVDAAGLDYVLVGGYAVSAFETRFSTDLDIVVARETVDDYHSFLTDRGFERQGTHERRTRPRYTSTSGGSDRNSRSVSTSW